MTDVVQRPAHAPGERIYDRLADKARQNAVIPRHVRAAYRWTPLRDVFLDARGRVWHAETDALRHTLPPDPEKHERIPPQFWHPRARAQRSREQHEEQHWAQMLERADLELAIRNPRRGGAK